MTRQNLWLPLDEADKDAFASLLGAEGVALQDVKQLVSDRAKLKKVPPLKRVDYTLKFFASRYTNYEDAVVGVLQYLGRAASKEEIVTGSGKNRNKMMLAVTAAFDKGRLRRMAYTKNGARYHYMMPLDAPLCVPDMPFDDLDLSKTVFGKLRVEV